MSWSWVVHLLWNKTPASSCSYQKQGRKRSSQELELSLAYVGYHNEQSKISTSQPHELGFGQTILNRMAGMQNMGTRQAYLRGKKTQEG